VLKPRPCRSECYSTLSVQSTGKISLVVGPIILTHSLTGYAADKDSRHSVLLIGHNSLIPRPYFQFGRAWCAKFCINYDSVGVVMEMHNIPPGESSSQVRVLEQLK
jgi:hypothetical protein